MNKILIRTLTAIAAMGVAYYLYNPKKYNRLARKAKRNASDSLQKASSAVAAAVDEAKQLT